MASIAKQADGRWRARYRDATGREPARHFGRKGNAQRWLDGVTAAPGGSSACLVMLIADTGGRTLRTTSPTRRNW